MSTSRGRLFGHLVINISQLAGKGKANPVMAAITITRTAWRTNVETLDDLC